jgi:hypothetical protein
MAGKTEKTTDVAPVPSSQSVTTKKKIAAKDMFLQLFWDLTKTDATLRREAAAELITQLSGQNRDKLDYTLSRLIKGASSSRDAARQGFSTVLTELLILEKSITVEKVLKILHDSTKVASLFSEFLCYNWVIVQRWYEWC